MIGFFNATYSDRMTQAWADADTDGDGKADKSSVFADDLDLCQKWVYCQNGAIRQSYFVDPTFQT